MPGLSQDLLEGSLTRAVSDVSRGLEVKGPWGLGATVWNLAFI